MRLLFAHHGYFPALAGAEKMTTMTAQALADRGHDVRIVGLARPGEPDTIVSGSVLTVSVEAPFEQDRACVDWAPDVVHAIDLVHPDFAQGALSLARSCGVPFALTPASNWTVWEQREVAARVCGQADLIFYMTGAERDDLSAIGVGDALLRSIPQAPGVGGGGDGVAFRRRHGVDGPMLLFLGRKAAFKGYRQLLEASALVWERVPDATFVFAGPPWDKDCEAVFSRHRDSRILDLGMVEEGEKEDALSACTALCLPSSHEVSPLVFVEAWVYGKPVIAGGFDGVQELVDDGADGLVVRQEAGSIAAAVTALLSDPVLSMRMGGVGREKAARGMSWERVAEDIERGYLACVPGGTEPRPTPR